MAGTLFYKWFMLYQHVQFFASPGGAVRLNSIT